MGASDVAVVFLTTGVVEKNSNMIQLHAMYSAVMSTEKVMGFISKRPSMTMADDKSVIVSIFWAEATARRRVTYLETGN